jgi:chromosome segregation ATPase
VIAALDEKVSGLNTQIRDMRKVHYESRLAFQNKQKELEDARSEILNLQQEIQKDKAVKAALDEKVSELTVEAFDLKDAHHRILKLQKEIQQTAKLNLSLKNFGTITQKKASFQMLYNINWLYDLVR